LTDNCIRREDHLNLSAGMWKVYLHGNEFRDGKVIQRITTDEAVLYVLPTGTLDGEPFPEIPASETERINARLDELEKGGIGKPGEPGADGFSPSASVEQTDDGAVITLTDKDGTTTATITNGKDGQPGEKGDPGNDYVLTDADKQEIAGMIPGGGSGESDLIVTITENEDGTYTADHTYTEIGAALDAKRQVRVITHLGKVYYYRGSYLSAGAFFEFICYSATNQISFYRIYENGSIVYATQDIVPELRGATANANGWWGYVPQPLTGQQNYILHGDGAWREPAKTISSGSTDAEIPTAKAVYDAIQAAIPDSGDNSGSSAGMVVYTAVYIDGQATVMDIPEVYPDGANALDLLAAGQVRMVVITPSSGEDESAEKFGVLEFFHVDISSLVVQFVGTITGINGNEAVMLELSLETNETTIMPLVQNSAGSGSSGGGGVVTITDNGDGTYSSSHTPAEIAAMAQTGAVVAVLEEGVFPLMQYNADMAVFSLFMLEDDIVGQAVFVVTNDGVSFDTISYYVGEMHGADTDNDGTGGTVPAPAAGEQNMVLHGDGTWRAALSEDDKTDLVHRVIEKLPTWEGGTY
ncbi:MAG: hypothetical protein J6I42_06440, partial [Clostridia bacterium]|nr:hypothetical protein [Clostridia bacterium]